MNAAFDIRNALGLETEQPKTVNNERNSPPVKTSPDSNLKAATSKPRYIKLEQDHKDLIEMQKNLKEQAERIRVSERLRIEITKGLKSGSNPSNILLTALECISLMTGDKLFYEQNMKALNENRKQKGYGNEL